MSDEDQKRAQALAEKHGYSGNGEFSTIIAFSLKHLKNLLQTPAKVSNTIVDAETDISKHNLNDESFHDETLVANDRAIRELESNNENFLKQEFKLEFYDANYENLTSFAAVWTGDYTNKSSDEGRKFAEAILLCLYGIGRLSDDELLRAVASTDKEVMRIAESEYLSYRNHIKGDGNKNDKTLPVRTGEIEDAMVVEEWTGEAYEGDIEGSVTDIRDMMESTLEAITRIPDEHVTSRVKLVGTILKDNYESFMDVLFNNIPTKVD